jgi:hypothetical protein
MIIICHGMVKSASSFVTQISLNLINASSAVLGGNIVDLRKYYQPSNGLFLDDSADLDRIVSEAIADSEFNDNDFMLIKLHRSCTSYISELIENGSVIAVSTYRDPRDIALSLVDAARIDEEKKKDRFTAYKKINDTIGAVDYQISCFKTWANVKNVELISFEDVADKPYEVCSRIAARLKISFEESVVSNLLSNKENIWEYNKGKKNRWKDEFSDQENFEWKNRVKDFYNYIDSVTLKSDKNV